jgi:hypothetical protein
MRATRQAEYPLRAETRVRINGQAGDVYVGVQNIILTRIDVDPVDGLRRVVLNLVGTEDIDRLVAALQVAREQLVKEHNYLEEFRAAHPEAFEEEQAS